MRKFLACSTGMFVAIAGAMPVFAQTDGGADTLQLEEVVVTAEKRETDLQKTAISIQVYSGEELKKEGKKRIDEIMSGVVGVQSQGSQVGTDFYMRGVGNAGGGMGGGERAVAVLIDGVYQNRTETVRGGTLDVAQVEVMRGTQSTNLGASSLAGAVSLVSNQPVFEYQGSGSLEVGNFNKMGTEGVVNVPLSDNQAIRFAFSTEKRDGYLSSGAGDSDQLNASITYRWQATDDINTVFTLNRQKVGGNGVSDGVLLYSGHWAPWVSSAGTLGSSDGMGGVTAAAGGCVSTVTTIGCPPLFYVVSDGVTYKQRSNPWDDGYPADVWPNNPFRNTTIDSLSADINWTTGLGTLTIKPSYQKATFRSAEPPRGTSWREENQTQRTSQLDAQLASSGNSTLTWLAGAYYYYTETSGVFKTVLFPGANDMGNSCDAAAAVYCYSWQGTDGAYTRTASVYGNASYPVLDTLRLTGGLRYSRDTKYVNESDSSSGAILGPSSSYVYDNFNSHTWSATTYSVGVEYDVFSDSMLYGKYATGYQPGNANANDGMSSKLYTDAQKIEQITLGLKNRFLDNTLQLNIELFNSAYHNRELQGQFSASLNSSTSNCQATSVWNVSSDLTVLCFAMGYPQVKDFTSRGADVEVSWLPTVADRVDLSVEYLKATQSAPDLSYLSVSGLLAAAGSSDTATAQSLLAQAQANAAAYEGLPTQNSPEWSGNVSYSHVFNFVSGGSLTPKVNAAYKSAYWSAGGPNANAATAMNRNSDLWQKSYVLYNAYLTWQNKDGKFSVVGNVKNIQNKAIMTNYGGTYVTLDAPRTFGVNFSANF